MGSSRRASRRLTASGHHLSPNNSRLIVCSRIGLNHTTAISSSTSNSRNEIRNSVTTFCSIASWRLELHISHLSHRPSSLGNDSFPSPDAEKHKSPTMKCFKPGTDQEIELFCYANGVRLAEYEIPQPPATDNNTVECLVVVSSEDRITVAGRFSGSVLNACFDVLADGSYVGDRRLEGSKTGEIKYISSRKIDAKNVLDTPEEPGRTAILASAKVVEGELHVKDVRPSDIETHGGGLKLGVGSLAVVVSLNQHSEDNYITCYSSMSIGSWQQRSQKGTSNAGLLPTHKLEFQQTKGEASHSRATKHKRRFQQTRYGSEPWARIVFHYRSATAIHRADCSILANEPHTLEPLDGRIKFKAAKQESSIFANRRPDMRRKPKIKSQSKRKEKESTANKTRRKETVMKSDQGETQNQFPGGFVGILSEPEEEDKHATTAESDEFDVENLMALLQDPGQTSLHNATHADTIYELHGQRNAFGLEQRAEGQQYMQQGQASLEEQIVDLQQSAPTAPTISAKSCSEVINPYLDRLFDSNTTSRATVGAVLHSEDGRSHMFDTDHMDMCLHNQTHHPSNKSLMTSPTMAYDDRLDDILLADRTMPEAPTVTSRISEILPASPLTAPWETNSRAVSYSSPSEPTSTPHGHSEIHTLGKLNHKAEKVRVTSRHGNNASALYITDSDVDNKSHRPPTSRSLADDVEMAKLKPLHDFHVREPGKSDQASHQSAQSTEVTQPGTLSKRVRSTSPKDVHHQHSHVAMLGTHTTVSHQHIPSKKPRLGDLEIRKQELLQKLRQKRGQKIAAQKVFEQQQKGREEEERAYLESERLRAEEAERQRIEAEERQRELHERQCEQEALSEIERLEQQLGDEDMEIKRLADQCEKFMNDWNEQRNLRDVEKLEREMENEEWTMEDIDKIQAELQAPDQHGRTNLFNTYS
nr:hypothetical protein CFP56_04382 [Quercus suber]